LGFLFLRAFLPLLVCANSIPKPAIPKKDTIFKFQIPLPSDTSSSADGMDEAVNSSLRPANLVFELHGNQFEFRPAERANRKFKFKAMDYL
jgi:ribonuclease P protein subunit POP4